MSCSSAQTDRLRAALAGADAVVIGAGAGLSTSAGFVYTGERFEKYFRFRRKIQFSRYVLRWVLPVCNA